MGDLASGRNMVVNGAGLSGDNPWRSKHRHVRGGGNPCLGEWKARSLEKFKRSRNDSTFAWTNGISLSGNIDRKGR